MARRGSRPVPACPGAGLTIVPLPETLRSGRLALRRFEPGDEGGLWEYSRDEDWRRFQQATPASQQEAAQELSKLLQRDWEEQPAWAITQAGRVVGVVALAFRAEHRIATLGYGIHRELRGRGLTGEAVAAVVDEAFAVYPQLEKVTAHTDARNASSSRLLEKLGFTREGTLRCNEFSKAEFVDDAVYGVLRAEWSDPQRGSSHVPTDWPALVPRLFVEDAEGLVSFVRDVFGAKGAFQRERPSELRIGSALLMVADTRERGSAPGFLYVYVPDADAAHARACALGAVSLEAPRDLPYGDRRAMVRDPWGNTWQIATHSGRFTPGGES